jgi:hypothetical protein
VRHSRPCDSWCGLLLLLEPHFRHLVHRATHISSRVIHIALAVNPSKPTSEQAALGSQVHYERDTEHRDSQVFQRRKVRVADLHQNHWTRCGYIPGRYSLEVYPDRRHAVLHGQRLCAGFLVRQSPSQVGGPECRAGHYNILGIVVGYPRYHGLLAPGHRATEGESCRWTIAAGHEADFHERSISGNRRRTEALTVPWGHRVSEGTVHLSCARRRTID